jgi:hypothetical protein
MVQSDQAWMVPVGWICALVFPIAGFVIGILLPKQHQKHQTGMIAVSVIAALFYLALFQGAL